MSVDIPSFVQEPVRVEPLEELVRGVEGRAVVTFQSVVRRDREGSGQVDHVVYEADLVRAVEEVRFLAKEISETWRGAELLFQHRLGPVRGGETSVFMAVSAARREDALAACRFASDRLKSFPGLRKKDVFRDGTSRFSHISRETILLSDDAISLPQS